MQIPEQIDTRQIDARWRKMTVDRVKDKVLYDWIHRIRPDGQSRTTETSQKRKRLLLGHPGKTLAEILPDLPKELCDKMEANVRSHWDEIEVQHCNSTLAIAAEVGQLVGVDIGIPFL